MIICAVNDVSKTLGGNKIFENLRFEVKDGERIGLVGTNGSGKTTILKLISGVEPCDAGKIHIKKEAEVGYLEQIPSHRKEDTVRDVLCSAFEEMNELNKKMRSIEQKMAEDEVNLEKLLKQYGDVQEKFTKLGGYEMDADLMKICNGLGIANLLDSTFLKCSGGEQTKIGLGLILLKKPQLLLLDEPTNHLDIQALQWLEDFIKTSQGSILIVSHDRYFLDEVATKIIEIEDGELHTYHGNYSYFVEEKEKRLLNQFAAFQEQQKKIKKMRETIKQLIEWANRANPPNAGLHKRAKNMERAIERMEKIKKPKLENTKMKFDLHMQERSGKDVVQVDHISKRFNETTLFENIDFSIRYQDRIALIGNNGSGKSTILKMILEEMLPDEGTIKIGSNVRIGYLSQHVFKDQQEGRLIDLFREQVHVTEAEARQILAKFMFYGHSVFNKVSRLSGGERMRVRLAQLMNQNMNLIILDEPTNHLDIDSREVLEETLEQFEGTILCVSHDRYLLNRCFNQTYWLENGKIFKYIGNYDDAKQKHQL
ncbi:ribosomal protection-like ABC-F family protein [Chengkuizengella sp. 2205SS18-9]|uniref:ABC-F type ribosomal protection protein n=1 Tax=Chengkuizengella axinellae TaxID=3064388 RepID=A0ABT9J4X0_9BACL|nr:ABC-F type ribosomal protection protein [Chengkuizengella sp. 2205SS18-9]MDP5276512.1 ABC-F type ribosomal protection protein [Chengkuizengella sp. 2205SS18-9]